MDTTAIATGTVTVSPEQAQANREHEAAAAKHQADAKAKRPARNLPAANAGRTAANRMAQAASALQARAAKIVEANKPTTKTQAEADAMAVKTLRQVAGTQMELHTTAVARLATAWRETALHLIESGSIQPDKTSANRLYNHIRTIANESFVATEKDKFVGDDGAEKENVVTLKRTTLADAVSAPTLRVASRAAMLLAIGSESKVTVGYLVADKLPAPILLPGYEVASGKPNRGAYYELVSAPANVLRPVKYLGAEDKVNKDGTYSAVASFPNDDVSLRPVLWEQINALFDVHFDRQKPVYETTSKVKGMQPTGMLIRPPVKRDAQGAAAAGTGTGAASTGNVLAKLGNTPEGQILALASKVRDFPRKDWGCKDNVQFQAVCFRLATEMLCRAAKDGDLKSKAWAETVAASELALLFDAVNGCVVMPRKDQYRTLVDDKAEQAIKTDNPPVLPEKKEEKKTA